MKVFLDTNVILEFFLDREEGLLAERLFAKLDEQGHERLMTVGSFYTMIFLIDKYLKKEKGLKGDVRLQVLRGLMTEIANSISVAGHDKESLLCGLSDVRFKDIEDSCQFQAAKAAGCDVLITFNTDDFPVSGGITPTVITPYDFLSGSEN